MEGASPTLTFCSTNYVIMTLENVLHQYGIALVLTLLKPAKESKDGLKMSIISRQIKNNTDDCSDVNDFTCSKIQAYEILFLIVCFMQSEAVTLTYYSTLHYFLAHVRKHYKSVLAKSWMLTFLTEITCSHQKLDALQTA